MKSLLHTVTRFMPLVVLIIVAITFFMSAQDVDGQNTQQQDQLLLTSMCSPTPDTIRVWRVRNLTNSNVPFTWRLYSGLQSGSGIAIANGDVFFETTTVFDNTLLIYVDGIMEDVKASNPAGCTPLSETPSPQSTFEPTPTPQNTLDPTPPPQGTIDPNPTPEETDDPSPTPETSSTPEPTSSVTTTSTSTFTATHTPSASPSFTPTFTATHTPSASPSFTPTFTATHTPSASPSFTPTFTATHTPTPTHTPTDIDATPQIPGCSEFIPNGLVYGQGGLVQAINNGNQQRDGVLYVICLESGGTYNLTQIVDTSTSSGLPVIVAGRRIKITAASATIQRVTTAPSFRIFTVNGELSLEGIAVANGHANQGAGVFVSGTLNLSGVTIRNNRAMTAGGGVYNASGTVSIESSVIVNNISNTGGGLYNFGDGGVMIVRQASLQSNQATEAGGGIFNFDGSLTLTDSLVFSNSANTGGGIQNGPAANSNIRSNNITGNIATSFGGGIYTDGLGVTVNQNCLLSNTAPTGSELHNAAALQSPVINAENNWWGQVSGPLANQLGGNVSVIDVAPSLTGPLPICGGRSQQVVSTPTTTSRRGDPGLQKTSVPRPGMTLPPPGEWRGQN